MKKETSDKLFTKVASQDKAARLLAAVVKMRKEASAAQRKAEVQIKLASIMDGVLNKKEAKA